MHASELLRRRIEAQGYSGLSDDQLRGLDPWLRFTPFLMGLLVALGTIAKSPFFLFALTALSALAVGLPNHPFDHLYDKFVRPFENSPRLPRSPGGRKSVYAVQCVVLAFVAWGFLKGHVKVPYALGWTVAADSAWLAAHQISLASQAWAWASRPRGRV